MYSKAMLSAAMLLLATDTVGDFDIPSVLPLRPAQLTRMRSLAKSDGQAGAVVADLAKTAQPLLSARPNPLEVIHYEGLLNTDARRIATVAKLREMADVATLTRYWQASNDPKAADALMRFARAWSSTYRITGNDVNENKFTPLLVAYFQLRPEHPDPQVDAWVSGLGERHARAVETSDHLTNRYTKHVRLTALCGLILDRPNWIGVSERGVRRFVTESLYADGTSRDLKARDTLTYHNSALRPILELLVITGRRDLYSWQAAGGGSLKKSVEYVVPYALGEKQRREWLNSTVDLDRRRSEAGIEHYRRGRLFEPIQALPLMQEASLVDPSLSRVVRHLSPSNIAEISDWTALVRASLGP